MKKIVFIALCVVCFGGKSFAQQTETDAIKKTISTMFEAMRKGDSTLLSSTFAKGMALQGISPKGELENEKPEGFLKAVGTPHKDVWDERITWGDIKVDANLASVWTPYKFYLGDKFSHCGINFFQLMKTATGWKIIYIVDTRRKDNCPE